MSLAFFHGIPALTDEQTPASAGHCRANVIVFATLKR
jgi:hypothetical protein